MKERKKKGGIRGQFILLSGIFLTMMLFNYLVSQHLINNKKDDEKVVSLAARQEVLIESYLKNFFFFMETQKIKNVTEVVKQFENNFAILMNRSKQEEVKDKSKDRKNSKVAPQNQEKSMINVSQMTDDVARKKIEDILVGWGKLKKDAIGLLGVSAEEKKKGYENLINSSDKLRHQAKQLGQYYEKKSNENFVFIDKIQIVLFVLSALFAVGVIFFLNRTVIKKIVEGFRHVSTLSLNMKQEVAEISLKTSNIEKSSEQLTSSVTQTMSSVTEISQIFEKSSELTDEAFKSVKSCSKNAKEGTKLVTDLSQSLHGINQSTKSLMTVIEESNEEISGILCKVRQIEEQTKMINEIVFQLKLLSFNASVEAARAGEHGKGFAVVAEEVGNLAKTSGEASVKISQLLEDSLKNIEEIISGNTERIEHSMSKSRDEIQSGVELGAKCDASFKQISNEVAKVEDIIQQVNLTASEQLEGVKNIETAMYNISSEDSNSNYKMVAEEIKQRVDSIQNSTNIFINSIENFSRILLGQRKRSTLDKSSHDPIELSQKETSRMKKAA